MTIKTNIKAGVSNSEIIFDMKKKKSVRIPR